MNRAKPLDGSTSGAREQWRGSPASDLWRWARTWWQGVRRVSRRRPKRLRLCESLPLGERRFVAVVEFEQSRFLIGGTQASLVLLAPLHNVAEMEEARDEPSVVKAAPAPAPAPRVQP
jgi:hypothetical protein